MTETVVPPPAKKNNIRPLLIGCIAILLVLCICVALAGVLGGGAVVAQRIGFLSSTATPTLVPPTRTPQATDTRSPSSTPSRTPTTPPSPSPTTDSVSTWPVAYSDNFTSGASNWGVPTTQPRTSEYGTFNETFANNKFRIQINSKKGVADKFWPSGPVATDQFVSVQAREVTGPPDAVVGLLFRIDASGNHYAFFVRDDRQFGVYAYQGDWSTLIDWTQSDAIKTGQPNVLAAQAQGAALSFFINNQKVAQVTDSRIRSGQAGVIVEVMDAGQQAVFEFTDFVVRAPAGSALTPTPRAASSPTPGPGRTPTPQVVATPSDPSKWRVILTEPFTSNANGWNVNAQQQPRTTDYGTFRETIGSGKLHVEANAAKGVASKYWPDIPALSSFTVTVNAQRVSGPTTAAYGIIFRRSDDAGFGLFEINDSQEYSIAIYTGQWNDLVSWTASASIKPGAANKLSMTAQGTHYVFSINNQQVADLTDDSLPPGQPGVGLDIDAGVQATFEFSGFEVKAP